LLLKLEAKHNLNQTWHEIWGELHHQGDVGEASYAAVPHLVRIYREHAIPDWNTYAIIATIELARGRGANPEVPAWLKQSYGDAIRELACLGSVEVLSATKAEHIRAILSVIALARDARTSARFLLEYSEEELLAMEKIASAADSR
jgi:hypothetical protein